MTKNLRNIDQENHLKRLQDKLNYHFKSTSFLEQALTHKSHSKPHNERMEFLGDSILGSSITIYLYKNFPELSEGVLSRTRASLVKGETLALVAQELELGELLLLGSGELKSGGHKRQSILADAVEAIIGAIFLDSDFDTVEMVVIDIYKERLQRDSINSLDKDPKSRLQEYLQAKQLDLPHYEVIKTEGKDHNQTFTVLCRVKSLSLETQVKGKNRRSAERQAAEYILSRVNA